MARRRGFGFGDLLLLGGGAYLIWRYKTGQPLLPANDPLVMVGGTLNLTQGGCGCTGGATS